MKSVSVAKAHVMLVFADTDETYLGFHMDQQAPTIPSFSDPGAPQSPALFSKPQPRLVPFLTEVVSWLRKDPSQGSAQQQDAIAQT